MATGLILGLTAGWLHGQEQGPEPLANSENQGGDKCSYTLLSNNGNCPSWIPLDTFCTACPNSPIGGCLTRVEYTIPGTNCTLSGIKQGDVCGSCTPSHPGV